MPAHRRRAGLERGLRRRRPAPGRAADEPAAGRRRLPGRHHRCDAGPPEHLLLVVKVVSPGSETTDRIVKAEQYATAGISYYWRVEQPPAGVPVVHTHVLDPASSAYRAGPVFTGLVQATAPFPVTIDLARL